MQRIDLITMGSDPELFLEDEKGKVISAIGKVGGTKDKPRPIKDLGKGFAVQEDNVLLEYNTPPARGLTQWATNHRLMREYLVEMVGKLGLKLSAKASHSMDDDQLNHPNAFVFGCDPDYNVWKMKWNTKPKCDDPKLRSAGGHVHVCYSNPNQADSIRLGRLLDYFVGAPLAERDPDKKRRLLYGKPGAIRFKPYGLEYRTPSNFWTLDQHTMEAVYCNVQECVQLIRSYDQLAPQLETARAFLAGEETDWNREYFTARGMPYVQKKKTGPATFDEIIKQKLATEAKMKVFKAVPESEWLLGEAVMSLDEEGDVDEPAE